MTYKITNYSYKKAKELNVTIKPSKTKNKKIDVFKEGQKIATIGDDRYLSYPEYIQEKGLQYANKKRNLYRKRHSNDLHKGNGYYANKILW